MLLLCLSVLLCRAESRVACVTVPLSLTAFLIDQLHIVFAAQIHTWRNTLKMNAHSTLYPAIICNETWQEFTHISAGVVLLFYGDCPVETW